MPDLTSRNYQRRKNLVLTGTMARALGFDWSTEKGRKCAHLLITNAFHSRLIPDPEDMEEVWRMGSRKCDAYLRKKRSQGN